MPWTVADVDKHRKDLTPRQKEVWVKVANDALTRCKAAGQDDCEARAVRQANAVAARNMTDRQLERLLEDFGPTLMYSDEQGLEAALDDFYRSYIKGQTFNLQGVEIFAVGEWKGDKYTEEDLDAMVAAHGTVGFTPPLKLGHNKEQEDGLMKDGHPAFGWVDRLYRHGTKLLADFRDVPRKLYEAMKRGNYKTVSSEIFWNYSKEGRTLPRVLKAVSLLGADIPAVTTLEAIENLYEDEGQDFKTYEFSHGSDDQAQGAGNPNRKKKEGNMELQKQYDELKAQHDALETKYAELEESRNTSDTELKEAKEKLEAAEKQLSEREAEVRAGKVAEFVASRKKEGRVTPAVEKELTTLLLTASDEKDALTYTDKDNKEVKLSQRELLEKFVGNLPKVMDFSEHGQEGDAAAFAAGEDEDPRVEVDRRVQAFIKAGKAESYSEAMGLVLSQDADLKKAYAGT